jgi:hypothetical protein
LGEFFSNFLIRDWLVVVIWSGTRAREAYYKGMGLVLSFLIGFRDYYWLYLFDSSRLESLKTAFDESTVDYLAWKRGDVASRQSRRISQKS